MMKAQFSCDMTALNATERQHHGELAQHLHAAFDQVRELSTGYAARLPSDPDTLAAAAEFLSLESRCCPFFELVLRLTPEGGPLWIEMTGPAGIKPFIRAEFGFEFIDESDDE